MSDILVSGLINIETMVFASFKIGEAGAADGFLDEAGLEEWYCKV